MANILLTWELGVALGHVANLLPIARGLLERGHQVHVALRDLSSARVFAGLPVKLWQAPHKNSRPQVAVAEPRTFGDILFNCGFGEQGELSGLVQAWQSLLETVLPTLLVAEHSPSALLAAHCFNVRAVIVGGGFICPPAVSPFPDLRPWIRKPLDISWQAESQALAHVNELLRTYGKPTWPGLGQLFGTVRETMLNTCPELDPYAPRPREQYFGSFSEWGGKTPVWPDSPGRRIWGYLKPFPALGSLLALLAELKQPTLIVSDGIPPELQRRFSRPWLKFEQERLDMGAVLRDCDLAITNANHGTSYALLQHGKPGLYLPLHLEQTRTAHAINQLGAGVAASVRKPEQIAMKLMALLHNRRYATQAQALAPKIAALNAPNCLIRLLDRLTAHLS